MRVGLGWGGVAQDIKIFINFFMFHQAVIQNIRPAIVGLNPKVFILIIICLSHIVTQRMCKTII